MAKMTIEQHVELAERLKKLNREVIELGSMVNEFLDWRHEVSKTFLKARNEIERVQYMMENVFYRDTQKLELPERTMVYTKPLGAERDWLKHIQQLQEDTNQPAPADGGKEE